MLFSLRLCRDPNPIRDARFWDLLQDVLIASSNAAKSARLIRAWLVPLLNRTPIAPIVIAYLTSLSSAQNASTESPTLQSAAHSLCLLWPLAAPRFSADTLLDCFGAVLRVFKCPRETTDEHLSRLAALVVTAYSSAVTNTSVRKKVRCMTLRPPVAEANK